MGWEWFEGRLARVSPLRLVLTQVTPTLAVTLFLVANATTGHAAWAIVFGVLLALEVAVVIAWWIVRRGRRRDARVLRDVSRGA